MLSAAVVAVFGCVSTLSAVLLLLLYSDSRLRFALSPLQILLRGGGSSLLF